MSDQVNQETEVLPETSSTATAVMSGREAIPKKRRFLDYRLEHDQVSDGFLIVEEFEEWDRARNEYRLKRIGSDIELPSRAVQMLSKPGNEAAAQAILGFCSGLRRELDKAGVKVYFDIPRVDDGAVPLRAKWTYYLDGRRVDDYIDWETLPDVKEMIRLFETHKELWSLVRTMAEGMPSENELAAVGVHAERLEEARDAFEAMRHLFAKYGNCRYYETREWKTWYGKAMQSKRERIVSAALAKKFDLRAPTSEEGPAVPASVSRPLGRDAVLAAARQALVGLYGHVRRPAPIDERFEWVNEHVVGVAVTFMDKIIDGLNVDEANRPSRDELAQMVRSVVQEHGQLSLSATVGAVGDDGMPVFDEPTGPRHPLTDESVVLNVPAGEDGRGLQKTLKGIIVHLVVTTSCLSDKLDKEDLLINRISERVASIVMQHHGSPAAEKFRTHIAEYDPVEGKLIIRDMDRLGTFIKKVCYEISGVRPSPDV